MDQDGRTAIALVGGYSPAAIYYEEADIVEYIRADVPALHRRIDEFLTLVLDLDTREPIGFALKGFRNYYLKHIKPQNSGIEFVALKGGGRPLSRPPHSWLKGSVDRQFCRLLIYRQQPAAGHALDAPP
jgi:hypothetical protein